MSFTLMLFTRMLIFHLNQAGSLIGKQSTVDNKTASRVPVVDSKALAA